MSSASLFCLFKKSRHEFLEYGIHASKIQEEAPALPNSCEKIEPPPPVIAKTTRGYPSLCLMYLP